MSKTVWVLLFVGGLIVGPGYFLFTVMWSGTQVTKAPLTGAALLIKLDPAMSPVRVIFHGNYPVTISQPSRTNRYVTTLDLDEQRVLEKTFSINSTRSDKNATVNASTVMFDTPITTAGNYRVGIAVTAKPELAMRDIEIEVRRNARTPAYGWLAGGLALLVAAAIGFALERLGRTGT